jgi:isopentenyldiphosphate isomerase
MENELLNIFDENRNHIGSATRQEVHKLGYWHETFHCWFISKDNEKDYIYFQKRSDCKKDYPNLLDITAAGHILAHETIKDGVREVKEELGIDVSFNELVPLGIIEYYAIQENFIDKEISNVFLYNSQKAFEDFTLQTEEVSGLFRADFKSFCELWLGERKDIFIEGFKINTEGNRVLINKIVDKSAFVQHELAYYERVLKLISEQIG